MGNGKKGYITVFLSLMLAVILILITTFIELARIQTVRFYTEGIMDISLSSIFSEYHRELFNRYGLFAIDTSYGTSVNDSSNTKIHLLKYMNRNFEIPKNSGKNKKDFLALHADNAVLQQISYLSDNSGEVLRYQIYKYMKETKGIPSFESRKFETDSVKNKYDEYEKDRKRAENGIDEIVKGINTEKKDEEQNINFENPADEINSHRDSSILQYAVKEGENISAKEICLDNYISHRNYQDGNGLFSYQKNPGGIMERKFFYEYIDEMCGDFISPRENSTLDYQKEYLLYGYGSDNENLDAFAKDVFMIRYVINTAYLFTNQSKQAELEALAAAVTTGLGNPELEGLVKTTLLYAWSYAESIQDMRILFDGKKVASVKTASTWNITIDEIFTFMKSLDQYREAPGGLDYEEYINGKLWLSKEEDICVGFMDLCEMDIRKTEGNQNFRMNHCIYQAEIMANVSSGYGYGYDITRSYSYE